MGGNATVDETSRFHRRLKRKGAHVLALESRVLQKREEVKMAARRQVLDKQACLSGNFLRAWRAGFDVAKCADARNRWSDQQFPVRSYSLMDNDVWQRDEMRRWFDMYSSPQPSEEFDALASCYMTSSRQEDVSPSLRSTRRIPPSWTRAQDEKAQAASMRRRDEATNRNALGSPHFMDMEGNLEVARVRSTLLASRLDAPKGWGQGHTHVAGFRSPPWKERPPQEALRYQSPRLIQARDTFMQAGGGLEGYQTTRKETCQRNVAMQAGCGVLQGVGG